MTVQPGRKLEGLTFDQVETEVKRELELVQSGEEFKLQNIRIYRADPDREGCWNAFNFSHGIFSREDFRAEDWIFEDTNKPEAALPEPIETLTLTKDHVHTVVAQVLGRWYYNNADSHKIVPDILKRLGFE